MSLVIGLMVEMAWYSFVQCYEMIVTPVVGVVVAAAAVNSKEANISRW